MNTTNTADIRLDSLLNPDGFLYNPQAWTTAIAAAIARRDGLPELTHDHWVIIHALREAWRIAGMPDPGEEAKAYM